jgi:redox-sensing transcriptional repressor
MKYHRIPDEAVRRLPFYLRGLLTLWEQGRKSMSSRDLAGLLGFSHWQIRKDFSYFGSFGTPGKGYDTEKLIKQIRTILKLNVVRKAALVGVGNLGLAVLKYPGFRAYGFQIAAAFDNDRRKIGRRIGDITVEDVSRLRTLKKRGIDFGIITVPCEAAQRTFDALARAGVKGVLSFSPCQRTGLERAKVITIDIAMDLVRLPYYTPANREKPKSGAQ